MHRASMENSGGERAAHTRRALLTRRRNFEGRSTSARLGGFLSSPIWSLYFLTWHDTVGFVSVAVVRCSRLEIKRARLVPDTKTLRRRSLCVAFGCGGGKDGQGITRSSGVEDSSRAWRARRKQGRVDMGNASRLLPKPNRVLFLSCCMCCIAQASCVY